MAVALILGAELARLTVAGVYSETRPQLTGQLVPRLPEFLVTKAMAEVGVAAAQGRTPPRSAMDTLRELRRVAPLQPEPLLVQAAIDQKAGDFSRTDELLLEARRRDPRSSAARYLLAQGWLTQGRIEAGLNEMATLSRLLPESAAQLAPALSQYARTPGATSQLKGMLRSNPRLKQPLLGALAANPENLPIILEIEGFAPDPRTLRSPKWHETMFKGLVRAGDYERAYSLWQRLSGYTGARPLLFNGGFRPVAAPPPFNWSFNSGGAGVIEPGDGRMHVLYYGRDNATLVSQLLLLPPGEYRLSIGLSGNPAPGALDWAVYCLPQRQSLVQLDVVSPVDARFRVPATGCAAQMIELLGQVLDMPKDSDLLIGPANLQRIGA